MYTVGALQHIKYMKLCLLIYLLKPKLNLARHVTSRLDTTRHVRRVILAVSSLSNNTARHARHDALNRSDVSCRVET